MLRASMYTRTEKYLNSRCAYDDRINTCRRRFGCTADKLLLVECIWMEARKRKYTWN